MSPRSPRIDLFDDPAWGSAGSALEIRAHERVFSSLFSARTETILAGCGVALFFFLLAAVAFIPESFARFTCGLGAQF